MASSRTPGVRCAGARLEKARGVLVLFSVLLVAARCWAAGTLQIHFMNVGQGDGALLVSPNGETVLFDNGVRNDCDRVKSYLDQLGVEGIDYHVASHYHDDHIGCTVPVLQRFPLRKQAFDRGGTYGTATFRNYTNAVGALRKTAVEDYALILDEDTAHPVRIEFVALNGNGIATQNENDLSLVCVVRCGQFDAVIGGDLSGFKTGNYEDIESSVAAKVKQVEVYKVNHHGSRYSSNANWMQTIQPRIGIISCGSWNTHGHPTVECLTRLHEANVMTYWTEQGNGAVPIAGWDKVGGHIIVEYAPGEMTFTVTYDWDKVDQFVVWNPVTVQTSFAWSRLSRIYHFSDCAYVKDISPANLRTDGVPPAEKRLHVGCPR